MKFSITIAILLSVPIALGDPGGKDGQTFECLEKATAIDSKWGYLLIKKDKKSCGFIGSANFIAIGTKNLTLSNKDSIKVVYSDTTRPEKIINGPIEADYLGIGSYAELAFNFDAVDNSSTLLSFTTDPIIKVQGDRFSELLIQSFQVDRYNLEITKTIDQPLHAEVYGGSKTFGHYIINSNESTRTILVEHPQPSLKILTTPITGGCSNSFTDDHEAAHDLAGPQDISKAGQSFRCVNVFDGKLNTQQAHYDVSFANFMDISDINDKLTISDGSSTLVITKFTANTYYQQKPVISFKGPNLVVIYDNPQVTKKTFVSKLTVNALGSGGVIDNYGTLPLPAMGRAKFSLRSNDDSDSTLTIKGEFKGADLTIGNFTLMENMLVPPEIVLPKSDQDYFIEVNIKSKPSWSLEYQKSSSACGGVIFGNTGSITLKGGNKTCYWLLGAKSSLNIVANDMPDPKSCLEIYSLTQKAPVFSKCSISPIEVLPNFIVGPAYVKVNTAINFAAYMSEPITGFVASTSSINSIGYPIAYPWYDTTDVLQINATGKTMILSVNDLDLREGESLVIDSQAIEASPTDVDISNKTVIVSLRRSATTIDYKLHRGVAVNATQFEKIIVADVKSSQVVTPKNLTNLLVKISAPQKTRLVFNISGLPISGQSTNVMIDSPSIIGRRLENANSSSTTGNHLLLWFKSEKTLPEITVKFSQVPCNVTSDHICDNDSRCIPASKMCKGKAFCEDGSDLKVACSSGPAPPPKVINTGVSGVAVFFLSLLMLALGSLATLYGPNLFKTLETRFRSGQYTTFSSTE